MDRQPRDQLKRYPVSLQCAAEAVFGPDENLKRLLRQSQPERRDDERTDFADGLAVTANGY